MEEAVSRTGPPGGSAVSRARAAWSGAKALARSVRLYHGDPVRRRAMASLYAGFVGPGDLVFDVGAHVGDRTAAFRRLGCRVVAVEPQPSLARFLRATQGWRPRVSVIPAAVGREAGETQLHLNPTNPTVATASRAFVDAAAGAEGWHDQRWEGSVTVPVTTLDVLIARFGTPAFVKIDVEGFEAEALHGLGQRLEALSFEFTTIQRDVAHHALDRLGELGVDRFDASLGESQQLVFGEPIDGSTLRRWLDALPTAANSGDIYALADR
ncbi:MAG: FkbM family methyltransferase [Pseudomonadota bacterium]